MELTLQQVIGQNPHLNQRMLAVQSVLSSLCSDGVGVPGLNPKMQIPFSQAAVLWIFGAIVPRGTISQDGMMVVIQLYGKHLLEHAEQWEQQLAAKENELLPLVLAIADRKLVQITGVPGCYDLQRCQQLAEMPATFEGISYNLAVPVRLEWLRIQREIRDGTDAQAQRNTPGRSDPSNRAARAGHGPIGPGGPPMGPDHGPYGARRGTRNQAARSVFEQAYGSPGTGDDG